MSENSPKPKRPSWAPRVPQVKIRCLYKNDAQGILDETLVDDVGIGLYLRCKSILTVTEIYHCRRLPCPACGTTISIEANPDTLRCDACGWHYPWEKYRDTFRHQKLDEGGAGEFFAEFIRNWERAATARERLLLIDRLIHRWHWEAQQEDHILGRPTGVNMIEGSRSQVIEFLNTLTYGPSSSPEALAMRDSWRKLHDQTRADQAAWGQSARPPSEERKADQESI